MRSGVYSQLIPSALLSMTESDKKREFHSLRMLTKSFNVACSGKTTTLLFVKYFPKQTSITPKNLIFQYNITYFLFLFHPSLEQFFALTSNIVKVQMLAGHQLFIFLFPRFLCRMTSILIIFLIHVLFTCKPYLINIQTFGLATTTR